MTAEAPRSATEGDALRYEAQVDLSETNTARTQLVLMTGENKQVLEVGPATGYITQALRDRGCRVTGLEIDPAAAEISAAFAERMIVGDIEAMDLEEELGGERFDVVMYGDVLEHLVDPEKVLVKTRSILTPGGRVVASIPNVAHASVRLSLLGGRFRYRDDGLLDRTHLRFFTRESIEALFDAAGYELGEIRVSTTGPFGTELGLRGEDFPPTLVEAVMSLQDSDTYQFIVDARPGSGARSAGSPASAGLTRETLAPLWQSEEGLAERDRRIQELLEEVEWLRDVSGRAEEARRNAEGELERVRGSSAYRAVRRLAGAVRPFRRALRGRSKKTRLLQGEPERPQEPGGVSDSYHAWIERFEPGPEQLEEQRRASERLSHRPLVVVALEASDPNAEAARRTIESIEAQTYDHWELRVGRTAEEAVARAEGDFVAFVEPGDLLAPFALYEVAAALNRDPDLDVLYSDHDAISTEGTRSAPVFTPEWSPDLLLSTDYMSHLLVVRTTALRDAGGLRSEMGEESLWDLTLRLSRRTTRIARIPSVLYHARLGVSRPPQGTAVRDHLRRTGQEASLELTPDGGLRITWRIEAEPKVSVIIPTRHSRELLLPCLSSIQRASYRNLEILVAETAPRDREKEAWYRDIAGRFPLQVLWWERPFNYSAVNNWAAARASGEILLFLNDDTEAVGEDWLAEMVGWAQQEQVGAVGAQLLNDDGTIQHGGITVGLTGFAGQLFKFLEPGAWSLLGSTMWYRNVLAVTGACMAMRREVFESIGGWDESYLLAGSDVELGLRIWDAGYRVVCSPFAQLLHREQATRGSEIPEQDFHTSFRDYERYLKEGDPFFSPSLSYHATIPELDTGEYDRLEVVSRIVGRDLGAGAAT